MPKAKRMRAEHKERAKRLARGLTQLANEVDSCRTFNMLNAISLDIKVLADSLHRISVEDVANTATATTRLVPVTAPVVNFVTAGTNIRG